jgi:serine protease SohB
VSDPIDKAQGDTAHLNDETIESADPVDGGDNAGPVRRRRVYVLSFDGDMEASGLESLRQEITAVLTMAEPQDEVMLRLESPGGMVHAYGLASSQLLRFKQKNIPLTVCVDKVAASGGYMMACVADRLIAAPFAILGSIGVLVQLPNIHRLLKKNDVDFEMITAGEYKRTLTPFSEITEKGREKVKQDVEEMHELFKQWVKQYRPVVDIDQIATGETWVGLQAQERNMVDMISTSDDYLVQACDQADVYEVNYEIRVPLGEKLGGVLQKAMDKTLMNWWQRLREHRYF